MSRRGDFERWLHGECEIAPPGCDGFGLGVGGWWPPAPTTEDVALLIALLEAQHEHLARQFADVELVAAWWGRALEAPDPKAVFDAAQRLGWLATGPEAPGGARD